MTVMSAGEPRATWQYRPHRVDEVLEFLKRVRNELSMLRKVQVGGDFVRVLDVNGDYFQVDGVGYPAPEIRPILDAVHAVYNPDTIHNPALGEFKEFLAGRRHPWAEDRVM